MPRGQSPLKELEKDRAEALNEIVSKKSFPMNRRQMMMVQDIMIELGYDKINMVLADCIAFRHKKLFPAHRPPISSAVASDELQIERSARRKIAAEEARAEEVKKKAREAKLAIARQLHGRVYHDMQSGSELVDYFTYNLNQRYEQTASLNLLNEDMVLNQLYPSKEEVAKTFPDILEQQ